MYEAVAGRCVMCKIQWLSLTSKTKLYFKVLSKRVSRWHTNKPCSSLTKDHSFAAYCSSKCTSTKLLRVYVRSYDCHSPLSYLWIVFVCVHALISLMGFTLIYQHSSACSTPNEYQTSSTVHSGINLVLQILFHYIDPRLYS